MRIHKVLKMYAGGFHSEDNLEEKLNNLERTYSGLRIESIFPFSDDQLFYIAFSYLEEKPNE